MKVISSDERSALSEKIRSEFKTDYIDDQSFLSKFPSDIAPDISLIIGRVYESSSEVNIIDSSKDSIYKIFGALRSIYVSLWLEENGYGEKLAVKMAQLIYLDDYGDICLDDWFKELGRFTADRIHTIDGYLHSSIPKKYQDYADLLDLDYQLNIQLMNPDYTRQEVIEDVSHMIMSDVERYYERLSKNHVPNKLDDVINPYEYERSISDAFSSLGWTSYSTSGSGDQGADVIAEKNGLKLVVQCKLYSSSIGNKAVQEVAAALGFYHGDISAVITNSDFTKSAKQLAQSLGVYLLHHSQIAELDAALFADEEDFELDQDLDLDDYT